MAVEIDLLELKSLDWHLRPLVGRCRKCDTPGISARVEALQDFSPQKEPHLGFFKSWFKKIIFGEWFLMCQDWPHGLSSRTLFLHCMCSEPLQLWIFQRAEVRWGKGSSCNALNTRQDKTVLGSDFCSVRISHAPVAPVDLVHVSLN